VYGVQEGCQLEVEEEYPGIDPTVAVHQLWGVHVVKVCVMSGPY
jgi:hypothetical protein